MMSTPRGILAFFLLGLLLQVTFRLTKAGDCDLDEYKKFKDYNSSHTVCLGPSITAANKPTDAQKKEIVDYHNTIRSQVDPKAANMLKMEWDDEVAFIAQKRAAQCKPEAHDENYQRYIPNRFSLGQNRARHTGDVDWTIGAMDKWDKEKNDFVYGVRNTNVDYQHYTQMAWASSNKIGCGHAQCEKPDGGEYILYICNYGPGGNIGDAEKPYKKGSESASDCPDKKTSQGLCDCPGKECDNWGLMNVNTCECDCNQLPDWTRDNGICSIDCDQVTQEGMQCFMGPQMCFDYPANWPAQCPHTCRQCKTGTSVASFAWWKKRRALPGN